MTELLCDLPERDRNLQSPFEKKNPTNLLLENSSGKPEVPCYKQTNEGAVPASARLRQAGKDTTCLTLADTFWFDLLA